MKYCTESNMQYNIISNLYFIETKFHISAVSVCEEKKGNYAHTHQIHKHNGAGVEREIYCWIKADSKR